MKRANNIEKAEGMEKANVGLGQKFLLTLPEASQHTGLGKQTLRELSNSENCEFVLWNGSKRMFKRSKLEQYLDSLYSI